ncbi:potassium-transporting ATPase subunit F [Syntrophomonas curvata]
MDLVISGLVGLGLLVFLFYCLMKAEEL